MKVAKEGLSFILPCFVLALFFVALGWIGPSLPLLLLAAAFIFFFRDPAREIPEGDGLILAPADGKILGIETGVVHPWLNLSSTRVTIFLSLFDVHITRAPMSGKVLKTEYVPGRFLPAYREEAGRENEHNSLLIAEGQRRILMRQVVGVAARRIKCYVKDGDNIRKGQRIGLMYFGSRVELYLPPNISLDVIPGQKVKAGTTVVGEVRL